MRTSARTIAALSLLTLAGWLVAFETPLAMRPREAWKDQNEAKVPRKSAAAAPARRDAAALRHELEARYGKGPLRFEPNTGQFAPEVKFAARGLKHTLFLTSNEARLVLSGGALVRPAADGRAFFNPRNEVRPGETVGVRLRFIGSKPGAFVSGVKPLPGRSNYLIGNDPRRWRTGIVSYAGVRYQGIYPGVDLVYYGKEGQLEYDFIVAPGADPGRIALGVESNSYKQGASHPFSLRLDASGDLVVGKDGEEIRFRRPVVYQESAGERHLRDGRYELKENGTISFVVGSYDMTKPLIIDPVLTFSTFLGGSAFDRATAVAVDSSGNIYVTGDTNSADFPTVGGVPPNTLTPSAATCGTVNCPDVFVTKLDPTGLTLLYSTYIGGSGADGGNGITVDASGNAFVTGYTDSIDFPTTSNAYQQTTFVGQTCGTVRCDDAFVLKLNAAGNALSYSSYLGTPGEEYANAIAIDSTGNAYITGYVASSIFFPATPSAFQKTPGGGTCGSGNCGDAFVAKFDPAAATEPASLVYATYLGGDGNDSGLGIAVDSTGNAYVAGGTVANTSATDSFPTTAGALSFGGVEDAFITELNSAGSALVYSTFLGGNSADEARGIALDSSGNAYVTGLTVSSNFPTATGALLTSAPTPTCASGLACYDSFVAKINPHLTGTASLVYSTYLGGSEDDRALAIAVDSSSGNAYVTGRTNTKETDPQPFPLVSPLQNHLVGDYDVFVTEVNSTGTALVYSTYLGGTNFDAGLGIALDSSGAAIVAGWTYSTDFPFTPGVVQTSHGADSGSTDGFVVKISPPAAPAVSLSSTSVGFGTLGIGFTSATKTVTLRNMGSATLNISSISITGTNAADFDNPTTNCGASVAGGGNCAIDLTFTPTVGGARNGTLEIADNASGTPHQVALTGTGTAAPAVGLSPTGLAFGTLNVGTSGAKDVLVTNTGTADLVVSSVTVSPADFQKTSETCTAAAIAPANTCTITVTFTPSVGGLIAGAITVNDNAPGGNPRTIPLSGTGVVPDFSLSKNPSSATISAGQSAPFTVTVTPDAGFNQPVSFTCSVTPVKTLGPTCSFSPNPATPSGGPVDTTLTVKTRGSASATAFYWPGGPTSGAGRGMHLLWLCLLLAFLSSAASLVRKRHYRVTFMAALLLVVLAWASCGGGGGGSTPPPPTRTPAGTYTVNITATAGSLSHPTSVSVTVN